MSHNFRDYFFFIIKGIQENKTKLTNNSRQTTTNNIFKKARTSLWGSHIEGGPCQQKDPSCPFVGPPSMWLSLGCIFAFLKILLVAVCLELLISFVFFSCIPFIIKKIVPKIIRQRLMQSRIVGTKFTD